MSKSLKVIHRLTASIILPAALIEHTLGRTLLEKLRSPQSPGSAVLIKVPTESWCDVLESCLSRRLSHTEVRVFKHGQRGSASQGYETALLNALGSGMSTIAISATPETAISAEYHAVADEVLEINCIDVRVIRKVIRKITGEHPKGLRQIDLEGVSTHEAMAAIGAGPSAADCVDRLRRVKDRKSRPAELSHIPLLSELPLTDHVRKWTNMLLADLARLDADEITPSAIRFATLDGPPGTGKSLLAASIAKSSGWRFHRTSIQDWFNAGDGHLGAVTKAAANFIDSLIAESRSIGFIDELQSIPDRRRLEARGRDWWMPVVDGILIQIDRVRHSGKKVMLLGACNHYDLLDPALIRSGRLEKRIPVLPPSSPKEAYQFVRYYIANRLPEPEIVRLANLAVDASPAKIEAAVRDAEAHARRENRSMTVDDVTKTFAPDDGLDNEKVERLALHEAGHAVIARRLGIPVRSATIIPAGRSAGSTKLEFENLAPNVDEIEDMVVIQLAGRASDELFGKGADSGASSDLERSTQLLNNARNAWGLYGKLSVGDQNFKSAPGQNGSSHEDWLEAKLGQLMFRSRTMARHDEKAIRALAGRLAEMKLLHADAISEIIDQHPTNSGQSGNDTAEEAITAPRDWVSRP